MVLLGAGLLLDRLHPKSFVRGRALARLLGGPLIVSGLALAWWATLAAGPVDLERPTRVLGNGPYARSRHPMYVGWTAIYLGVMLVTANLWLLMLLPGLLLAVHRETGREERQLDATFGAEYDAYRSRVPRYF